MDGGGGAAAAAWSGAAPRLAPHTLRDGGALDKGTGWPPASYSPEMVSARRAGPSHALLQCCHSRACAGHAWACP